MTIRSRAGSRMFVDSALDGDRIAVDGQLSHYLSRVLRLQRGDRVIVFNGRGDERIGLIESLSRHGCELRLGEALTPLPESPIEITLVQGLIKSDAMDLVVQKATELGVRRIVAVRTEFSVVKLARDRLERRHAHWTRIARSACEQSLRHQPPTIEIERSLESCLRALPDKGARVAFHIGAEKPLSAVAVDSGPVCIAVGPEGGFGPGDTEQLSSAGFELIGLGQRVLRAETAAITVCALTQFLWGDLC